MLQTQCILNTQNVNKNVIITANTQKATES